MWSTIISLPNAALLLSIFCMMTSTASGQQVKIVQEAERNYSYIGKDSASVMSRTAASNDRTLWVRNKGDQVSWAIAIPEFGTYSLVVRYSNDNFGALDSTSVKVNGDNVGEFENLDTGGGGTGWNVFVDSPTISLGELPVGQMMLSLYLDKSNAGVEYDKLTLCCGTCTVGAIDETVESLSDNFNLMQNYPNPFNPSTEIRFGIPRSSRVKLEVYDALGLKVAVLVDERLAAGHHIATFDGRTLPSGVYYFRLSSKDWGFLSRSMLMIK